MSSTVQTWVCRGCGQQNTSTSRSCAACQCLPDGTGVAHRAPRPRRTPGESLLPGLVTLGVLLLLVAAMVIFRVQVQAAMTAFLG